MGNRAAEEASVKTGQILFSGQMIRAILEGRKTVTRRIVKGGQLPRENPGEPDPMFRWSAVGQHDPRWGFMVTGATEAECAHELARLGVCPYGRPGDHLRVKEAAWMWCERQPNGLTPTGRQKWHYVPMREAPVIYAADHPDKPQTSIVSPDTGNQWGWRLKIGRFLPAWAVRIELEVTAITVERLNGITEEQAVAEGAIAEPCDHARQSCSDIGCWGATARGAFGYLWETINDAGSWAANPWVWVIEFKQP